MKSVPVRLFDSFADDRHGGNAAGVVMAPESLTDQEMMRIAGELNQTTTAFWFGNGRRGRRVRFFTPTQEVALCGHALLAAVTAGTNGDPLFDLRSEFGFQVETPAGKVGIRVRSAGGEVDSVWMKLGVPRYREFRGEIDEFAVWLGAGPDGIDTRLPIEIASTGLEHLLIPVRNLSILDSLDPNREALAFLSAREKVDTISLFTLETVDPASTMHLRDLAPAIGNLEEAASGTTNAALAGYLIRHRLIAGEHVRGSMEVIGEQGYEMGRPSLIHTFLELDSGKVESIEVGGRALCTLRGEMILD